MDDTWRQTRGFGSSRLISLMTDQLPTLLTAMAALLSEYGEQSWGAAFAQLADEYADDPKGVAGRVRASFGGMASLNDIVLYRDGSAAIDATQQLDELRHKVYEACRLGS